MKKFHVSLRYATPTGRVGSKNTIVVADTAFEAIEIAEAPIRKRGCSKFDGSAYEMEMFQLKENQYSPNGLGRPAATYYYFVDGRGNTIDLKTLKPYRGKQMERFAMKNKTEAENYLKIINK